MIEEIIKFCDEENIDFNSLFILYYIAGETDDLKVKSLILPGEAYNTSIIFLEKYFYVDENKNITDKGKRIVSDLVNRLSKNKKSKKDVQIELLENEIEDFVDEYRKQFQGLKAGSMGDRKGCINKFIKFKKEYPEFFNKKLILGAVKMYIDSVTDYKFLTQADYFIYKNNNTSKLASFCEEVDLDKIETHSISRMV
jgi:predicted CopG family antitoxin